MFWGGGGYSLEILVGWWLWMDLHSYWVRCDRLVGGWVGREIDREGCR